MRVERSDDDDGPARGLDDVGRQDVSDDGSVAARGDRVAAPAPESSVPEGDGPERIRPAEVAAGSGEAGRPGGEAERPREPGTAEERTTLELDYRATVDAANRAYAIDQAYEKIRGLERNTVTPAMRRIESEDPGRHLAGLENSRKGKDRLAEKVVQAVNEQPQLSYNDACALVKDAIRYTLCYPEERYTAGVLADCDRLEQAGFKRVDRRNTWESPDYKGINSRWRAPESDQMLEVQFHTRASYDAKQETHAAYEKLRDPATPKAEQERLAAYQRQVNTRVPTPPGALGIPDYP